MNSNLMNSAEISLKRVSNSVSEARPLTVDDSGVTDCYQSAIYKGTLEHCRVSPKRHYFSYRVFMMYLDLDEIDTIFSTSRLWSNKTFNLSWMRRKDFIGNPQETIYDAVVDEIFRSTGQSFSGSVRVLTNLRYFGFIINPISCYYCFDQQESLRFIVLEVTNTPWREKCRYVLECDPSNDVQRKSFEKSMHVSPFFDMDMVYRWVGGKPGSELKIGLSNWQGKKRQFYANLNLTRVPISKGVLTKQILMYPLMTMKVFGAIYWQALKLRIKGVSFVPHPER
ncbi:DUF1365 domain-containing protein [Aurantivibrio plasticivorans]